MDERGDREVRPAPRGPRGRFLRRLADMANWPKGDRYKAPPRDECYVETFNTYPTGSDTDGEMLVVRMSVHRGLIVDFSINQVVLSGNSWVTVARIDCCGGTIHRHQYDAEGRDLIGHEAIIRIPAKGGEEVVNKGYDEALRVMHDEYYDNLRRWNGDTG